MPAILKPAVVLVLWSIGMFLWAAFARNRDPAARQLGVRAMQRPADIARLMSSSSQNKIDNYNHLMEQPTIFYAIVNILALSGGSGPATSVLAWSYVGLRVVHSLVQATTNDVRIRLPLFLASTGVLAALGVDGAIIALH